MMDRQLHSLAPEFHQNLPGATEGREPLEDRMDRLLDSAIRVHFDLAAGCPTVTRRQVALEFAPASLLSHRFQGSLPEQMKFKLIYCSLQSKEQSIIRRTRIVYSFRVDDDRADKSTQLDQMMPIPAIPRQTGRLNAEDCSNLPTTDFRDQTLKAWTVYKARSRLPRSSSIVTTSLKPSSRAYSASPY